MHADIDIDRNTSEMSFDLSPRQLTVSFSIPGGEVRNYILREASADAGRKYRNIMLRGSTIEEGKVLPGDMADGEIAIVGECLLNHDSMEPVGIDFAKLLPNRVVKPLFAWIKANSDLEEKANPKK